MMKADYYDPKETLTRLYEVKHFYEHIKSGGEPNDLKELYFHIWVVHDSALDVDGYLEWVNNQIEYIKKNIMQ